MAFVPGRQASPSGGNLWHSCQSVTPNDLLALVKKQLATKGVSAAAASTQAVGNHYLIRNMERGHRWPTVDNLMALCRVLGLEFYVGPPRGRTDHGAGASGLGSADLEPPGEAPVPERLSVDGATAQLPVRRWRSSSREGYLSEAEPSGAFPAPEDLPDPDCFYAEARNWLEGHEGIFEGDYCLISPNTPVALHERVWLRRNDGVETIKRLVGIDGDTYRLRGWTQLTEPHEIQKAYPLDWKRAEVAETGVVLAVYRRGMRADERTLVRDPAPDGRLPASQLDDLECQVQELGRVLEAAGRNPFPRKLR